METAKNTNDMTSSTEMITTEATTMEPSIFTVEEIKQNIHVEDYVLHELTELIEDHLNKCGIYHRIVSRVKSPESLAHKFESGKYSKDVPLSVVKKEPNNDANAPEEYKRIQDLIGIRINLYYADDLEFCKTILNQCFIEDNWSATETTVSQFQAAKLNGVFHIPENLLDGISPETFNMAIDKTFEVQIRTVVFDAWHEVEHDMRYKNSELWKSHIEASRQMNSILATLELCDNSMVTLLEELAHTLYKEEQWVEMLRLHYRVRMQDVPLYDGIAELLADNGREVGKLIYKFKRIDFLKLLLNHSTPISLNPNSILLQVVTYLINDDRFNSKPENQNKIEKMKQISAIIRGEYNYVKKTHTYTPLKKLTPKVTFKAKVVLGEHNDSKSIDERFKEATQILQKWTYDKYSPIFPDLTRSIATQNYEEDGYSVNITADKDAYQYSLLTSHIDLKTAGRIWYTKILIYEENETLFLEIKNHYKDATKNSKYNLLRYFAYPRFYRDICEEIGVTDGRTCREVLHNIISDDTKNAFLNFVNDENRSFPIVLFVLDRSGEKNYLDDTPIGKYFISGFKRIVWSSAHIYGVSPDFGQNHIFELTGNDSEDARGIYLIPPIKNGTHEVRYFSIDDVIHCKYDWMIGPDQNNKLHNILVGPDAFRQKLIDDIKMIVVQED